MTQDITTTQGGAIATASTSKHLTIPGLEDFVQSDFRPGRWKIVQTTKQAKEWGVELGTFYNPDTGDSAKTLEGMVVLAIKKGRGANKYKYNDMEAAKNRGEDVTDFCHSSNAKVPDADSRERQAQSCADCDLSKFTEVDGKRVAPACKERRTLQLLEIETGIPSILTAYKAAVPVIDKAVRMVATRQKPPAAFPVRITLQEVESANIYYVPVPTFAVREPLDEETARHMLDQVEALAEVFGTLARRDAQEGDGHGEVEAQGPTSTRGRVQVDNGEDGAQIVANAVVATIVNPPAPQSPPPPPAPAEPPPDSMGAYIDGLDL